MPRTALEQTVEQIKSDIFSDDYKAGDRYLSEKELCERFKVSRTTVREALKTLQALGVVNLIHGRGAFISAASRADINSRAVHTIFSKKDTFLDLTELRAGIEPTAAALAAARASEEEIFMLFGILSFFEKACNTGGVEAMTEADEKFHLQIAKCTHNNIFIKLYEQMSEQLRVCKSNLFSVENNGYAAICEHKLIAEAISNHNSDDARRAMEEHIANITQNILNIAKTKEK